MVEVTARPIDNVSCPEERGTPNDIVKSAKKNRDKRQTKRRSNRIEVS